MIGKLTFTTPWKVSFIGAGDPEPKPKPKPKPIVMEQLLDIAKHEATDVKYFSGTISYENQIFIDELKEDAKMILNLGEVNVAAEVFVNNKSTGVLWKRPFVLDISDGLKTGKNDIKVNVANLWINRVVGDQELPEDCEWTTKTGSTARGMGLAKPPDWVIEGKESPTGRKAFEGWKWDHIKGKDLVPSGLVGPVSIHIEK